jgi:glycosyltransferase involved in cell wall biosynthesis/SAM-dependent methyltransferase/ribosomal protein L35
MLKELNGFHKQGDVHVRDGAGQFDYSDGYGIERYLKTVLENARDLSSHSPELEDAIQDWATEYHLSSKRANLLRGFDLSGCRKVLELGCGCGAITRFLGEQGLSVDAIEGSLTRAELAALRCRDLENVSVYCGNFNDIELPENHYDLICLVGVTEYAGRFMTHGGEGANPVVRMLAGLRNALVPEGVVAVAIENRTGMKYVLGAHEDHYGKRLVGLNGYFGEQDINTYTLTEWEAMFRELNITHRKLYLPFPDYKVPTVLMSQEFARNNPNAFCLLEGLASRDYVEVFKSPVRESLLWQSAAASNSLDIHSNSFLFLLSLSESDIDRAFRFDFANLPGFTRRREFCLVTTKPEGQDTVTRRRLAGEEGRDDASVSQRVVDEPYHAGMLLSVLWARALEIEPDGHRFLELVRRYVSYLEQRREISIDLTSSNIVVDDQGSFHSFDEEWTTKEPVSPVFLLFRSLLIFVVKMGDAVREYARNEKLETVEDFIIHVGDAVGLKIAGNVKAFTAREEAFQNHIAQGRTENRTRMLLDQSLLAEAVLLEPIKTRLYWRNGGKPYVEELCRLAYVENVDDVQTVSISLPPAAGKADQIRFNPCEKLRRDGVGFMRLYSLEILAIDPVTGNRTRIWGMSSPDEIVKYASFGGISYMKTGLGSVFMVTDDDPRLEFPFLSRIKLADDQYLEFSATLRFPRSQEYLLARERYLTMLDSMETKVEGMEEVYRSHQRIKEELADIKSSNFWAALGRYKAFRHQTAAIARKAKYWVYLLRHLGPRRTLARARRQGAKYLRSALGKTPEVAGPPTRYEVWRETRLDRQTRALPGGPLISVVMPVHNVDPAIFRKAVKSVESQTYRNWELCIADDASTRAGTLEVLKNLAGKRIKVTHLAENRNISGATNAAIEMAGGEYLAFMDNDDELPDNALFEVAAAIVEKQADCIYTDEDFIRTDNHLDLPHFKPDYNPDLLLSHNYITHLLVVRRDLFDRVGGLRSEYDGAQDYDLVLRIVEMASNIVHVAKPLYHWRMSETSTSLNPTVKPGGHGNAKKALEAALQRRGIEGTVEETPLPHFFRVKRAIDGSPLVSIVIPFRDKPELLRQCVVSILEKSTYANFQILGISNDSYLSPTYDEMDRLGKLDERVVFHECNIEFNFSKLVNFGVSKAGEGHVVLLNNDIEVITPDWIEGLLEHSQRPEVAAVGGKLYYPNNTIQHAGLAIGLGGYAGHLHKHLRADSPGYFNRLNVIQDVSALTGAMMMVERKKYLEIGSFDETSFGVAYNDVDFCLRARERGYLNVFTPHVEAYHHESASRGYEDDFKKIRRFNREKENLKARHGEALERGDPYYNPNLDRNRDDFRLPEL